MILNDTIMIEAPEAVCLSEQLNRTIRGKRVADVFTGYTSHKFAFFCGTPDAYSERLMGKTVGEASPRGGMVEVWLGNVRLVFTDGANLSYFEPGAKLPAKHQFLLGFEDQSCVVVSVRMYGGILCFESGVTDFQLYSYYAAAKEKPQVLSEDFDRRYFMALADNGESMNKSAKAFLATDQTIPGLGNGVLQDILYRARIHPRKKVKELTGGQREELFRAIKETLTEMRCAGGRSSESDLFGRRGNYVPFLSKETTGTPCRRCGEVIRKESYLGGSVYYCVGCQAFD